MTLYDQTKVTELECISTAPAQIGVGDGSAMVCWSLIKIKSSKHDLNTYFESNWKHARTLAYFFWAARTCTFR